MSLADPLNVATIGSYTTPAFGVISRDGVGSVRVDPTSGTILKITHSDPSVASQKPSRHYVQLTESKDVADPYTGLTKRLTASVSISVSIPALGWTAAQQSGLLDLLTGTLADSEFTSAKLIAYQS